jgi:hypothetical protein
MDNVYKSLPHDLYAIVYSYVDVKEIYKWEKRVRKGKYIEYIPKHLISILGELMCEMNLLHFKYCRKYQTQLLCNIAEQHVSNIYHINKKFKTTDFCMRMIDLHGGKCIKYINKTVKTIKVCKAALYSNIHSLQYTPKTLHKEIVIHLYEKYQYSPKDLCCITLVNKISLKYIPERFVIPEAYILFLRNNSNDITYIPERFKTSEFYKSMYKMNHKFIAHIPKEFITQEMCLDTHDDQFKYFPDKFKTQEMCLYMFDRSPYLYFMYIPDVFITEKMCHDIAELSTTDLSEEFSCNFYEDSIEHIPQRFKYVKPTN